MNSEFAKRMIVAIPRLSTIKEKFNSGKITNADINEATSFDPSYADMDYYTRDGRISLLPWEGLSHLQHAIRDTVDRNIEGDFLETGIWQGGACILARLVYNELKSDKIVFAADSFEGLPKPDPKYVHDNGDDHYKQNYLSVSLEDVKKNFEKFGCLDGVVFIKGWFKDTMPVADIDKLSILRLDGDMYESTMDVLINMYHKLSSGGYCIIDDYFHKGCNAAVQEFRRDNGISDKVIRVTDNGEIHYWIKS
jgi:O-methyltransferase